MKIESFISKRICIRSVTALAFLSGVLISDAQQDLPKVIPPSPEASALFRFQDYPMDYSTGLPSISIPLYDVKSGSLSVPIALSYHASGRRVTDQDGPVALGWSLDAGGIISRTIYGSPDFGTPTNGTYNFPYPFRTTGLTNFDDYRYFEKIMHYSNPDANILPWTDSEYDVFSYNFGGNGGKFIFKDNNGVKTPVLLPYKPYIISPVYGLSGLGEIDITDDKGVFYKFATTEESGPDADYAVTSLSITQIISADKMDTIKFIYTGFAQWNSNFSQTRTYKMDWSELGEPLHNGYINYTEQPSTGTYQIKRLTEIAFKQGKVMFNLVAGGDKIDNIQVKDLNNNVIKTIQLNRSLLDRLSQGGSSQNPNLTQINNKLDNLLFKDNAGTTIEQYGFEYYPTQTTVDTHYCDWWGFFNNSGFINMIPDYYLTSKNLVGIDHIGGSDFNREPSLEPMKSGVLKKITYPTGGSTVFNYENNQYINIGTNQVKNGPGLRIAQVISSDNNGTSTTKTYKYGVGESGYGFLELTPDVTTMAEEQDYRNGGFPGLSPGSIEQYNLCIFHSGFTPSLNAMAGRPVIYTQVTEYQGTPDYNLGKTVYEYDNYAWAPAGMPAFGPQIIIKKHIYNFNYWNNPSLLFKTEYKNTSSPSSTPAYSIRRKVSNNYNINNIDDVVGLHVQRLQVWPQTGIVGNNAAYYMEQYAATAPECQCVPEKIFAFSDYHIPVGVKTLASTTESVYNDDGSTVTNTTSYAYNSRFYISQKSQSTSEGSSVNLITQINYPFDYTGIPVLAKMANPAVNMLNFPIEQQELKNEIPLKSVRTNYTDLNEYWPGGFALIKPSSVDIKKGANNYEPELQFLSYDYSNGRLTSVAKNNNVVYQYWYDDLGYPREEAINADYYLYVGYTSFEANDGYQNRGSWTSNLNLLINTTESVTGKNSLDLGNGTSNRWIQQQNLNPNKTYIVSYWSKNGTVSPWGVGNSGSVYPVIKPGRSINGWTYYEATFNNVSNIRVEGSGLIDELRVYPKDAQMTTYTYTPLVGITSKTGPNGDVTYYEYDSYGRLKLIRDLYGNILKTFKYQYQSVTP